MDIGETQEAQPGGSYIKIEIITFCYYNGSAGEKGRRNKANQVIKYSRWAHFQSLTLIQLWVNHEKLIKFAFAGRASHFSVRVGHEFRGRTEIGRERARRGGEGRAHAEFICKWLRHFIFSAERERKNRRIVVNFECRRRNKSQNAFGNKFLV